MTTQIARSTDPRTSHEAAAHMEASGKRAALKARIHAWLLANPQGGDFGQIANALGLSESEVWRRLSDLEDEGRAFKDGVRTSEHTGRSRSVWKAQLAAEVFPISAFIEEELRARGWFLDHL